MQGYCENCKHKDTCTSEIGIIWGLCNTHFEPMQTEQKDNKIDKNLEIASWHCQTENCNNCPLCGKPDCYKIVEDYNNKTNRENEE